jgi:hypothetical protein
LKDRSNLRSKHHNSCCGRTIAGSGLDLVSLGLSYE